MRAGGRTTATLGFAVGYADLCWLAPLAASLRAPSALAWWHRAREARSRVQLARYGDGFGGLLLRLRWGELGDA